MFSLLPTENKLVLLSCGLNIAFDCKMSGVEPIVGEEKSRKPAGKNKFHESRRRVSHTWLVCANNV